MTPGSAFLTPLGPETLPIPGTLLAFADGTIPTTTEAGYILLAYLLGSLPFGYLFAKAKGIDLRTVGSGNIGATNTARALGKTWGLVAFLLDFAKGWLPAFAAGMVTSPERAVPLAVVAGAAAVLGHCFPIYLRFQGGKGVATGCGAIVAIEPLVFLSGGFGWLVALALWRFVSLSSLVMGVTFPLAARWLRPEEPSFLVGAACLTLLIFLRHKQNLSRLFAGTEPRVGASSSKGATHG